MTSIADKKNNNLPIWGNEKTMNMNNLILTNILSSHYFKVNLYELKTYHEVIDEIYYKVNHLEPWEKGSRVTSGQTGMCGGVRGVGAGGIVSTAFCILYKLFTLKLTRKQVVGLINHGDSPYIRALGFMYIRYTQPPADLWNWYQPYLDDDEKLDVKAGGGKMMTVGEMLWHFLSKLEWFSTLFPRIPVPIQKELEQKISEWKSQNESKHEVTEEVTHKEDHWKEGKHQSNRNGRHKDDDMKDGKHRMDSEDEVSRERRKIPHDRERSRSHHRSSEYGVSCRSPYESKSHSDTSVHHSSHRNSDKSSYHRNRDHSRDRFSRDRVYSRERHSRSSSADRRHSHRRSRSNSLDKRHRHSHRRHH